MKQIKLQKSLRFCLNILLGTLAFKGNFFAVSMGSAYAQIDASSSAGAVAPSAESSDATQETTPDSGAPKDEVGSPEKAQQQEKLKGASEASEAAPEQQPEVKPEAETQKEVQQQEDKETEPAETGTKKKRQKSNDHSDAAQEQTQSGQEQSPTETQKPADYHAHTPSVLNNRLKIGLGGSLGLGGGPSDDFSSDYLGYYLQGSYGLTKLARVRSPIQLNIEGRYATHTGVDKEKSQDLVVQRFLLGCGIEFRNGEAPYRFGGVVSFGLSRVVAANVSSTQAYKTSYHFNASAEGYIAYRIFSKIALLGGVELAPLSDFSWYGLQLGTLFSF